MIFMLVLVPLVLLWLVQGACVRCLDCEICENRDGGINVVDGALCLSSGTQIVGNRGTGVRSLGKGSWVVQIDCRIIRNAWHGVSALEEGQAYLQKSLLLQNLGAGINSFNQGKVKVICSRVQRNRLGVWAQNSSSICMKNTATGPGGEGEETTLTGGKICKGELEDCNICSKRM
mmetsp:Transcript_3408/g.8263  ORF Transcript_3408/g.8263 Transcript_3408/m.8263 type:complete len:175 (+) Transcript_3408:945-1469(+)